MTPPRTWPTMRQSKSRPVSCTLHDHIRRANTATHCLPLPLPPQFPYPNWHTARPCHCICACAHVCICAARPYISSDIMAPGRAQASGRKRDAANSGSASKTRRAGSKAVATRAEHAKLAGVLGEDRWPHPSCNLLMHTRHEEHSISCWTRRAKALSTRV